MPTCDEKILLLHFRPDEQRQSILIINPEKCQECQPNPCLTICPSGVFIWNHRPNDPILVLYKQCIECGACRLACPADNIDFSYPVGGYGVTFSEG